MSLSNEFELYLLKIIFIFSFRISFVIIPINLLNFFIPSKLHSDKNIFVELFSNSVFFKKLICGLSKMTILYLLLSVL